MAEHTALLPERVLAPSDKAAVEGTIGDLMTSIIARLGNDTFLTLRNLITTCIDCSTMRHGSIQHHATIVCSQYNPEGWIERLGELAISDDILDRLLSKSYTIKIDGKISMRKCHAAD